MNHTMKRTQRGITIVVGACAGITAAQTDPPPPPIPLYSNANANNRTDPGIATGNVTGSGITTRPPSEWSEIQALSSTNSNSIAGISAHLADVSGGYRFADNFRVSNPEGWRIDFMTIFAYQIGAETNQPTPCIFTIPKHLRNYEASPDLFLETTRRGTRPPPTFELGDVIFPVPEDIVSPFDNVNLRIWNGPPNQGASRVVWGNTTANVFDSAERMDVYRVYNTTSLPMSPAPDSMRSIWRINLDVGGLELSQGTYWVDWQFNDNANLFEAFCPPITILNQRGRVGWNAMQFKACEGEWIDVVDPGKPHTAPDVAQDLPFLLEGKVICPIDFNDDNTIDIDDLLAYLAAWFARDPSADLVDTGDPPDPTADVMLTPDEREELLRQHVNINDLLYFLSFWFQLNGTDCPDVRGRTPLDYYPIDPQPHEEIELP